MQSLKPYLYDYQKALQQLAKQNLYRQLNTFEPFDDSRLRSGEKALHNFASNDYLGLSKHPKLIEAAILAVQTMGVGSGASRLVTGTTPAHTELDRSIAALKKTEAALAFGSGYAAALGTIPALVGPGDVVILDKLAHACLIDGAKLSGADIRVFPHNDLCRLEDRLEWARKKVAHGKTRKVLIVTESVFSMDGDQAPLRDLVELKNRYGAMLFIDEAHATGIFGDDGSGLANAFGLGAEIDVQFGTLSKAIGCTGGFVAGNHVLIEYLVNRARSFIFSTAPSASIAAAAVQSIQIIRSDEGTQLRKQLWNHVNLFSQLMLDRIPQKPQSPIVPVIVGDETKALAGSHALRDAGFFAPAIRFPTVARDSARIRITLSSTHQKTIIKKLAARLNDILSVITT
jgi:8-amino-7-oxononanoate synthase